MSQINTCSKYVLGYYYISAAVMALPHFSEFICLLCIGNEHFRRREVPFPRNPNHVVGINEILQRGFGRCACFIFSIVTELKFMSLCLLLLSKISSIEHVI